MNYTKEYENNQQNIITNDNAKEGVLVMPSTLTRFVNTETVETVMPNGQKLIYFNGYVKQMDDDLMCSCCGSKVHRNGYKEFTLKHIPIGDTYTFVVIKCQYYEW